MNTDKAKKMKTVTESIFSSEQLIIPMADVQHIERLFRDGGQELVIVTKHTKWDSERDDWANAIYVSDWENKETGRKSNLATRFLSAWCKYRNELESEFLIEMP